MRLVAANCDKERGGDRAYLRHLRSLVGRPGVLLTSERGHGRRSTRLRGYGRRVTSRRRPEVGKVGVHRWAASGWVRGIYIVSAHAPHKATVGPQANLDYLTTLAATLPKGQPWIVGGDFNRSIREVARILGGQPHGIGVDGFITNGIHVTAEGADDTGKRNGWTDHPAYWIDTEE